LAQDELLNRVFFSSGELLIYIFHIKNQSITSIYFIWYYVFCYYVFCNQSIYFICIQRENFYLIYIFHINQSINQFTLRILQSINLLYLLFFFSKNKLIPFPTKKWHL